MKPTLRLGFASSWLILPVALFFCAASEAAQPYGHVPTSSAKKKTYTPTPPSYAEAAKSSAQLTSRVDQLAKNDKRQDARLTTLERDVKTLKPSAGARTTSAPQSSGTLHVVRNGETLWRIAAKYNTSVNALRQVNRISGDTVAAGQALVIPSDDPPAATAAAPSVHVVAAGETFSGIAYRYKVTQDALAKANPSAYPDRLLAGEKLTIPGAKSVSVPTYTAASSARNTTAPAGVRHHVVQPGESLGVIAKNYGMPTATLAAANKLTNPNLVQVGRRLLIPTVQAPAPAAVTREEPRPVKLNYTPAELPITPPPPASVMAEAPAAPELPPAPAPPPAPAEAPKKPSPMPVGATRGVVAYRLEKGDDLTIVANMFSTTPAKIRELNMLPANAQLKEGDEIVVPALSPAAVE